MGFECVNEKKELKENIEVGVDDPAFWISNHFIMIVKILKSVPTLLLYIL